MDRPMAYHGSVGQSWDLPIQWPGPQVLDCAGGAESIGRSPQKVIWSTMWRIKARKKYLQTVERRRVGKEQSRLEQSASAQRGPESDTVIMGCLEGEIRERTWEDSEHAQNFWNAHTVGRFVVLRWMRIVIGLRMPNARIQRARWWSPVTTCVCPPADVVTRYTATGDWPH